MAQTQFGRFDKYDGFVGGFRAPLNAAMSATGDDVGKVQAVSINTSGRVVIGGTAETAIIGVICPVKVMAAGDIIDVMTSGEIVDAVMTAAGGAFTAGALVWGHLAGTVDMTATSGKALGQVVEPTVGGTNGRGARLVIRVGAPTTLS